MSELQIQFSTSTAWTSGIIRRLTHSRWSHVDIVLPGEGLLGVSGKDDSITDLGGVRIRPFNCWPYLYPPKTARIQTTDAVVRKTIDWGRHQLGVPFDNEALWAFLRDRAGMHMTGRAWRDPNSWFCSEFVCRAIEEGGLFTYPLAITKDVVSPNDVLLLANPFMTGPNVLEFLS